MPREKANTSADAEPVESEKQVVSGEKVDLDEDNDPEENMEEEYEYEEVEEEEEEEEEIEEEVEEVVEEEEEDNDNANEVDAQKSINGDDMKVEDEDEKKKHAELLALPPHGSEVYIGGIPHDASEDDLRSFCETIGEVTEVSSGFICIVPCFVLLSTQSLILLCFLLQVRIMKSKDSSENKGFAFVTFRNVELATKAIDELNNAEFKVI